ncbi:NAD(P)-binding protein [Noviherbaspirillum denitrificans]|uniref:Amine oxidase n=1 Tax=Noviherbaspirillum denitrificans TaxID=1968433 RepID=A0A254TMU9_9BURK|nr:NAD(P)-binding protein [Noviherbaspirillum denitrificans]OWW22672.1 amine oxidase [Noviherbaspirillum denitrificans]
MDRRSFLLAGSAGAAALLGTAAGWRHLHEIPVNVHAPGRIEGHFLRDRKALPAPAYEVDIDVAIFGSGVAGLTAAWKLAREGHRRFLVFDGPQAYGNAAGGNHGGIAYPTGAHYLPLPSTESLHIRELLHDLGILLRNPSAEQPYYDERCILHAPQERVLFGGRWQEGILPKEGLPQWELDEHERFAQLVERFRSARGSDGRRAFVIPAAMSSADPQWRALDRITFRQWAERENFRSPTLHWYLDYCCRDDYGAGRGDVSAWAGLHYFCSRGGAAENAGHGEWLTWPGGLHPLAAMMDKAAGQRRRIGSVASLHVTSRGVEALCFEYVGGSVRSFIVKARKAVCAMPLFVASRVFDLRAYGFNGEQDLPTYAPWLVSNFLMKRFPQELPEQPLSWDNVVYQGRGLGYVVSTHQDIRVTPPEKTVFTAYAALDQLSPAAARKWLETVSPDALLDYAASDLRQVYGHAFARCVERADLTLRPHAMASPRPGFLSNKGLQALRDADGPVLFAHADLSGFSVFEEAAWWGYQAALRILAA